MYYCSLVGDVQQSNSPILGCDFLPPNSSRDATSSTDITLATTQPPSVTTSSTTTNFPLPDELGSALISSASIPLLLLSITVSLLVR